MNTAEKTSWQPLCQKSDLIENSGVCTLVNGQQVAVFYLPQEQPQFYALGNWDPIGEANVLSRGILGDLGGRLSVASPLYKQHFDLITGECLEEPDIKVPAYTVCLEGEQILISL